MHLNRINSTLNINADNVDIRVNIRNQNKNQYYKQINDRNNNRKVPSEIITISKNNWGNITKITEKSLNNKQNNNEKITETY